MNKNLSFAAPSMLSRRQFLQGSAVLAALAGMGFNPGILRLLAQDTVALSLLSGDWGGNYNELLKKIGDLYSTENPNITIDWDFSPTQHDELLTRIAGGTPPDLALTYEPNTLARLGAFISLTPYIEAAGLKREDFVTALWDEATYDGQLYALPGGADYIALFYSKDMYRAAGLDPEKPPTTIAQFDEYNRKLTERDASGNVTRVGYIPIAGHLLQWGFVFGGNWYDVENQRVTANDPANVAALQWLYDYVQFLGYDQYIALTQLPGVFEPGNSFATGILGHFFEGFWTYEPLDNHAPDLDYGVALWPTLNGTEAEKANYQTGGWLFGIPSEAANPDAAWAFMKYAFVDNAAKMGVDTVNGPAYLPSLPGWEKGLAEVLGGDNRLNPYIKVFSEIGVTATKSRPAMPVSAYYSNERTRAFEAVLIGEKTAQEALDEVTQNVQAELDRALAS